MAKPDSTLWPDILQHVQNAHPDICRQWFVDELEPLAFDSGQLIIKVTVPFKKPYLENHCTEPFMEAAQAVTGNLVAVRFSDIEEDVPSTPAETQAVISRVSNSSNGHIDGEVRAEQLLLIPDFSFDRFVRGPENHFAWSAAVSVANEPGTHYNPLFIHGGVGLGKTHLLQAICQTVVQNHPEMSIRYLTCEMFVNDFLDCIEHGRMQEFRSRYRSLDLLVLDDIQFLEIADRTQEEFFHTFNELHQLNRQIVISSDRPPEEIPKLEERLVSRFKMGLVADISRPSFETRVAIVSGKAKLRGLNLPDEVVKLIASRIDTNARELEGAITTLQGHATLHDRQINLQLAYEVLGGPSNDGRNSQVTFQGIIDVVCDHYGVALRELQSKKRTKSIAEPRQVSMWLMRKRTRYSLQEIGGYFGGRDHTTVMHSIRTVDDRSEADESFAREVTMLDSRVMNGG